MSNNCCNLTLEVEESPRLAMQISGANYYGPYELPTMSADTKGGAKVGHGLEIENEVLGVKLVGSASGESFTVDGDYLHSMTVDGKSVQDGTPSPSAPVPVETVSGINLSPYFSHDLADVYNASSNPNGYWQQVTTASMTALGDGWLRISKDNSAGSGTAFINFIISKAAKPSTLKPSTRYTVVAEVRNANITTTVANAAAQLYANSVNASTPSMFDSGPYSNIEGNTTLYFPLTTKSDWSDAAVFIRSYCAIQKGVNATFDLRMSIYEGEYDGSYVPYGSIGLKVNDTIHPIDLQGNVLASLPDGTKDVLTVDGAGHCVIEKRVGVVDLGGLTWVYYTSGTNPIFYVEPSGHYWYSNGDSVYDLCSSYPVGLNANARSVLASQLPNKSFSWIIGEHGSFTVRDSDYSSAQDFKTAMSGVLLYYKLNASQIIDLGYIDLPALGEGAQVSIVAQVTPTSDISWWEIGAGAVQESLNAINARLDAIEAAIAELATA